MRGIMFGTGLAALASIASASVSYDLTGWGQDTTVKIDYSGGSNDYGLVVTGMYQPIFAQGINGGTAILGQDASGVIAVGQSNFAAVSATGYGYYQAYGVYASAQPEYNEGWGVYAETVTGYNPTGVKGYATTINSEPTIIGVHGVGQAWNPSYGGMNSTTMGMKAEAFGNGYFDYAYGIWASASGGSGNNQAGFFDGDITVTATCNCTPSDEKLKKNVRPLDKGLETVMALAPKAYDMKVDEYKGKLNLAKGPQVGMIAQDVEKVMPELVTPVKIPARESKDQDGKVTKIEAIDYKTLNYVGLIPVLVKAIQEQETRIQEQDAKIKALEAKLSAR